MAYKISFECSQKLTDAQLAFMRSKVEEAVDAMVAQRIDMPEIEDTPEYFYTVLDQAEFEVIAQAVSHEELMEELANRC